jgi:bacterioferritin
MHDDAARRGASEHGTMKGDAKIIEVLNEVLTAELTAINQYFIHARMMKNWGYEALAEYERKESIDEMKHAQTLMDRVLFLDGIPNVQRLWKVNVGESVPEQFECDLNLEYEAVKRLNDGIRLARELGDNGTADLFEKILVSEEEHIDWIESQLELIKQLGAPHYLAQQIHPKS